jgi:peptide/nickel transport system substrate-binding protein
LRDAFVVAIPADPGPLDPHHAATYGPALMLAFAYEGLVARDDDLTPRPGLAESWTESSRSITYRLRANAICADGSPLTAADVAANFAYIVDPRNGSPLLGSAVPMGSRVSFDERSRAVTITAPQPNSFLLEMTGSAPIVCRPGLDDRRRLARGTEGAGPYRLASFKANDHYTFELSSQRRPEPGQPTRVVFRVIPNQTTAANLLLAGELTAAGVSGPDRTRLERAGFRPVRSRGPAIQMWFNQAPGRIGADPEMRRALAMAVDRGMIARVAGAGRWALPPRRLAGAEPTPCRTDTVSGRSPAFDPVGAEALFDRLGWRRAADGVRRKDGRRLSLQLVYDRELVDASLMNAAAELAAEQWRAVGVEVHSRSVAGPVIAQVLFATSDYDISWVPVIVGLPSRLLMFTSGPRPPGGVNFPNIVMPRVEALAKQANQVAGEASCPLWDQVEGEYLRTVSVAPVMDADNPIYTRDADFRRNGLSIIASSVRLRSKAAMTAQLDAPASPAR